MQFNNSSQSIYLQIADYVCEKLLLKQWGAGEKIPSVREMSVELEVNPNTVMRTYEFLKQRGIIIDKRGIGYYITEEGPSIAITYRKEEFTDKELPQLFRTLYLLDIDLDDLKKKFELFKKQYTAKN
ncbi:MAG TPA: GntR family transcriptional regulator [Arachidicoccus sp.]|nr:GntR family transcriptional regulator [Arachidicoccus sp.]